MRKIRYNTALGLNNWTIKEFDEESKVYIIISKEKKEKDDDDDNEMFNPK